MRLKTEKQYIQTSAGRLKLLILKPCAKTGPVPGILWIHGGGYTMGMVAMVYASRGRMLAKRFGAVVVSPEYRLAGVSPYPAALEDCYAALKYMSDHREELGISKLIVGGESAGGGLAAAVCLYARDKGEIKVDLQIPLYPMLDCYDTESSQDNHGIMWDTKKNHKGWRRYLGPLHGSSDIPPYASPSRETDYSNLPPCVTFVLDGEPFYTETLTYVENLKKAGVPARVEVYHGRVHAFDMFQPFAKKTRLAKAGLAKAYERIIVEGQKSF